MSAAVQVWLRQECQERWHVPAVQFLQHQLVSHTMYIHSRTFGFSLQSNVVHAGCIPAYVATLALCVATLALCVAILALCVATLALCVHQQ